MALHDFDVSFSLFSKKLRKQLSLRPQEQNIHSVEHRVEFREVIDWSQSKQQCIAEPTESLVAG